MHQLDPSFKDQKAKSRERLRRRRVRRVLMAGAVIALVVSAAGGAFFFDRVYYPMDEDLVASPEMMLAEEEQALAETPYVPAIVNLAGDPLVITLEGGASRQSIVRLVEPPEGIDEVEAGEPLGVLVDTMLSSSERFMTALPSSPEDFAFFQAQRDPLQPEPAGDSTAAETPAVSAGGDADPGFVGEDEAGAGWGETIDEGQAALPEFTRTRIENTTSVASVVSEGARFRPTEDLFVRVLDEKPLDGVLVDNGFTAEDGKPAAEALGVFFGIGKLASGTVVAIRGLREDGRAKVARPVQISLYADDRYLASLALGEEGGFVKSADPWVGEDLTRHFQEQAEAAPIQRYRLIDAIYSTAARNTVPSSVIGEIIMHLSRSHDLNEFADFTQRLVLVYSADPRDKERQSGRVLFVAVRGGDKNIECFVYRPSAGGEFGCLSELNEVQSVTVQNGMVVPVQGVMTSTFGPRRHPILKSVRLHKGVDWAAPTGTPVVAAFAGTIGYAGGGEDYGNLVKIEHAGGRETRYAHLSRFAEGLAAGTVVEAGTTIGYVGTTGLSTGPHLHFELYAGGSAIDPLGTGTPVAAVSGEEGSGAVERLVNKIIQVESGGRADAKNPLSTATGLGQFIESTWVRMMVNYRPDLGRTMTRPDLLALRNDPTISREMVRNLARENEASLRSNGHQITAGRLYLSHFLGPEGANVVLSASPDADLAVLLGEGVIRANPFLTGQSASYVVAWAERKMSGRAGRAVASVPVAAKKEVARASPQFERYKKSISALVEGVTAAL
ncbi:MAG: peptidoglycan DD-metalloendopeptidase family protein [Rhizobiaceae bacterium]|nr:peptidoglycan DD-metalloendopeptidase family protein [Rhizobiaceae bacterium]